MTKDVSLTDITPEEALDRFLELKAEEMESYSDSSGIALRKDVSVEVRACPACGVSSESAHSLFEKEAFQFVRCKECALVFVNPRLNDEWIDKLYSTGRCAYQTKHLYLPSAERRVELIYRRKEQLLTELLPQRGKLLDFGSSTGYFLHTAVEAGWDGYGVELNPFGVRWAREELGLENVFDTDFRKCGFENGQFSAITMWDVLEHLPDPFPILRDLSPLLCSSGRIVIETTNYDCLETELLGEENTNIVGDMHLLYFNESSLSALIERAGFQVESIESFGLDLDHILFYDRRAGGGRFRIPQEAVGIIQQCVDRSGKGCYLRAVAQRNEAHSS